MKDHEQYMRRCFELARRGSGYVSPNPLVGAVLVHEDRIIGEGFHEEFGSAHAEIQAIESVRDEDQDRISESTMYVSLEPCNHYGQTPPCTDRIIREDIPRVVVSVEDPNPTVCGQSVNQLREHGIDVTTGVLEREGHQLIRAFETAMRRNRPYIQLKYARSRDGYMGVTGHQVWLSAPYMSSLVHRWRHEADAILVGRKTAEIDNPALTNRHYFGNTPLRLVIDKRLTVPNHFKVYDEAAPSVIFNAERDEQIGNIRLKQLDFSVKIIPQISRYLHDEGYRSLMVEGGAQTIRSFMEEELWDEAIIMEANRFIGDGISAPTPGIIPQNVYIMGKERIHVYRNKTEF